MNKKYIKQCKSITMTDRSSFLLHCVYAVSMSTQCSRASVGVSRKQLTHNMLRCEFENIMYCSPCTAHYKSHLIILLLSHSTVSISQYACLLLISTMSNVFTSHIDTRYYKDLIASYFMAIIFTHS